MTIESKGFSCKECKFFVSLLNDFDFFFLQGTYILRLCFILSIKIKIYFKAVFTKIKFISKIGCKMRILYLMSSSMTTVRKAYAFKKFVTRKIFKTSWDISGISQQRSRWSEEERRDSSFGGHFQALFGDGGIRL